MTRLVTAEMPTSAAKMRPLNVSPGKSSPRSLPPPFPVRRKPGMEFRSVTYAPLRRLPAGYAGHPVADAGYRLYDLGPRGVALYLAAQPGDVYVYVAALHVMRVRRD